MKVKYLVFYHYQNKDGSISNVAREISWTRSYDWDLPTSNEVESVDLFINQSHKDDLFPGTSTVFIAPWMRLHVEEEPLIKI